MNTNLTCIIVDNDVDDINMLKLKLRLLCKNIKVTGSFHAWEEAIVALRKWQPDLILMDITVPFRKGVDLLSIIPYIEGEIIFVTAFDENALTAFKFFSSGYILKPIDDREFSEGINRAITRIRNKKLAEYYLNSQPYKIGIPDNKGIVYVTIDEIQYLESMNGYTKVVMKDSVIISSFSIGKFNAIVTLYNFYQVHRSYIINLKFISRYKSNGEIVMQDGKEIPVSKNLRDDFLNLFQLVTSERH